MASHQRLDRQVVAHMACILDRNIWMEQVVGSLLPQVDALKLYLNNYPFVPRWLTQHDKVFVYHEPAGDLGASAKFYKHEPNAINLTVDDDLLYAGDYVARLIAGLVTHGGVVSLHGKRLVRRLDSYHRPRGELIGFHCLKRLDRDEPVHVPGTGAMAYDAMELGCTVGLEAFPTKNMADVWMAVYCKNNHIPVTALSHRAGIVKQLPVFTSLFAQNFHRDEAHTQVLNDHFFPHPFGERPVESRFSLGGDNGGDS